MPDNKRDETLSGKGFVTQRPTPAQPQEPLRFQVDAETLAFIQSENDALEVRSQVQFQFQALVDFYKQTGQMPEGLDPAWQTEVKRRADLEVRQQRLTLISGGGQPRLRPIIEVIAEPVRPLLQASN